MRRIKTAISIVAMLLAISIGVPATTDNASGRRPLQTKGTPTSGLFRTAANQSMRLDRRRTPAHAAAARKFLATEASYYTSLCEVTLSSPMVYTNLQSNIHADAGGALVDDTYYCIEQVSGSIFTISAYNADTWEQKSSTIVYGYDFFAHDLTYDPVDRKIYGCFMKTTEDGDTDGFVWGWLDTENLQRVAIADMPKSVAAVAATPEGVIYAIDYEGELSTVDKTNGQLKKIADTGLKSELATGGVIDPKTGILYYVTQTNADIPKVYAVNVTDGTSTAMGDLTEYQQLRGMFFPAPKASDNAPAAVSKIDMQIMGEALMGMAVITMPAEVIAGNDMTAVLTVENTGSQTAANGKISLTRNRVTVGEFDIPTLEPGATTTVEVSEHVDASFPSRATYIATLLIDGDGDDSDNYAASTIEFMYGYDLPAPMNLQGELKYNDAVLSWEAPTAYRGSEDGFENYEPFGFLQAIGPWRSIDGNGTGKITPFDGDRQVDIPTAGLAVGFQIFDSKEAKMESRDLDARSGTRAMVTFADKQGANNDWLISPEIKGGTEVTLYAKAGSQYFKENFKVLYSASDRNRESFRAIGETRNVGSDWTEIRFILPQDARYFAIRYCSFNCYALLIDDISYTTNAGEAELIGYNVYRDSEFLTGTGKDVTSHTDAGGKNHTYTVTALYDRGESLMTMPVVISGSGVEGITGYGVTVKAEAGILHVNGAEGLAMRIWRTDGTAVDARTCGAVETIPLTPGIYIIMIGDRVLKTVVN